MKDVASPLRDRTNRLILRLAKAFGADSQAHDGAIRHLGVAALNLATEADADTLDATTRGLVWLAVFARWEREKLSADKTADLISHHRLVRHLGPQTVRRHLEATSGCGDDQSNIRRTPGREDISSRADILVELATRDHSLERLLSAENDKRPDLLVGDSRLFATAVSARRDPGHPDVAEVLEDVLPDWELSPTASALDVLARFEATDFESVPEEFAHLGKRARRFEQSLANHLRSHDLLPALRAALALSPAADTSRPGQDEIGRYLARFTPFAADPTLRELTQALIVSRHRVIGHLRGHLPLSALEPWITYLRGPCAEFAERRGITLREATNFAHYALHLLDICDLAAIPDTPLRDSLRRALMDVEDELKEFALVGQRAGLSDEQSQLARFDDSRWRSEGLRARLADRLTRLCGGWRSGHRSGPPGSPPRPDDKLYDQCLQFVTGDQSSSELDALANLIGYAQFRGIPRFRGWAPQDVLALLQPVLRTAVRAPSIDVDRPFSIDLSPLSSWLAGDDGGRRADVLHTLLELETPNADLLDRRKGLSISAKDQHLVVSLYSTQEMDALLTLLASPSADDPAFAATLKERLVDHLRDTTEEAVSPQETADSWSQRPSRVDDPPPFAGN